MSETTKKPDKYHFVYWMNMATVKKTLSVTANAKVPGRKATLKQKELHICKRKPKLPFGQSRFHATPGWNIVGCRIKHKWKESNSSSVSLWTGTVLEQIYVVPSLFLIKYDDIDCVYGLEIFRDERVRDLEILSEKIALNRVSDAFLADKMLGRVVEHQFETEDGKKRVYKGLVLDRPPVMPTWFFITYDMDPMLYMYQLLEDYKDGDLRILPDKDQPKPVDPGETDDSLVGRQVEYLNDDASKRTGTIIGQNQNKPSVFLIKFDDDLHIHIYNMI